MPDTNYDLVVIGSGPAGQKGAIAASKLGKKVAVIEKRDMVGGVSVHSGTIPSKTLREAILYLTGMRQRAFYGQDYKLKERITITDLRSRVRAVVERQTSVVIHQLRRNGIELITGAWALPMDPFGKPTSVPETPSGESDLGVWNDFFVPVTGTLSK
jgi:NAD(P) transhydrogenase